MTSCSENSLKARTMSVKLGLMFSANESMLGEKRRGAVLREMEAMVKKWTCAQ